MKVCTSCAANSEQAAFPAKKPRGQALRCTDCQAVADRDPPSRARALQTRASYRAAYRHRLKQDQLDMVDQLRPPP